jgi:carbon-monoxide dehydrogenase medium subunit
MSAFTVERDVAYAAPRSIEEAIALLVEHDDAKLIAGGQSLLVFLRQGLLQPGLLVGLKAIPELMRIEETPAGLTIGAMVTQQELERSAVIAERYPALADAAATVASPLIRRQGTIGGNLCHADPTADPPAALIGLGAEVEIASSSGRRRLPVESLFVDYMETCLGAAELLVAVHLPSPLARSGSAYVKHRVRGVDTALVGAGVGLTLDPDGATIVEARIGLAGAEATTLRMTAAEKALRGRVATPATLTAAATVAAEAAEPLADTEGSEWYRREMIAVFTRRAAERALQRARDHAP